MNDARQILRYLFPGLATVFCFILVKYNISIEFAKLQILFGSLEKSVSILVLSGALGWVLSAIYYSIPFISVLDHRPIFANTNIKFEKDGNILKSELIDKRMAMVFVECIWQVHKSKINHFETADSLSGRYASVTHGLGTTIIGYLIVLFVQIIVILIGKPGLTWPGFGIWLIFFFLPTVFSFYYVRKTHAAYINTILVSYLLNNYDDKEKFIKYVD